MRIRTGFTLIELLVVISILGLMSSLLVVRLGSTRESGRAARAMADLDSLAKAVNIYFNDTNTVPPHDHTWDDACERAAFGGGNFSPKPADWDGPYIIAWPKNPWGDEYHWEFFSDTNLYSISVRNVPQATALTIDGQIDDGNLDTGLVIWNSAQTRLEYRKGLSFSITADTHFTACNP